MILVTGANGMVGRFLINELRGTPHKVRAMVRDPAKGEQLAGQNIEIAVAEMQKPETLRAAMNGVDTLFLLSAQEKGEDSRTNEAAVLEAAKAAGTVKYIVRMSGNRVDLDWPLGNVHRACEGQVEATGIAYTHLRAASFMSNNLDRAETIKNGAIYAANGSGKAAIVDPRDVAAVAAKLLTTGGGEWKNRAIDLTGPEALSMADQAEVFSKVLGKEVTYYDIPEEKARETLSQFCVPLIVDAMIAYGRLNKAGALERVSPDFEKLMGRKPTTFRKWVEDHAKAFKS